MMKRMILILLLCFGPIQGALAEPVIGKARLVQLFSALSIAKENEWEVIEAEIRALWQQSGSPSMDLLLKRGWEALDDEDTEAAIEHFTALVDHAPDFAEGWNARATAYFRADLYGPALADIRHSLALEPRHFGALAGLGFILEDSGKFSQALAAYQEVLKLHPNNAEVLEAVSRIEKALGVMEL